MVNARMFAVVLVLALLGSFTFYTFLTPSSPTSSTSVSTATTATQTVDHTQTITKTVNNTVTVTTTVAPSDLDQAIAYGVQNGFNKSFVSSFLGKYGDFGLWAYQQNKTAFRDVLSVASKNGTLFDQVYRNPTQDPQVASSSKYPTVSLLSQLFSQQERYSAKLTTIHLAGNITNYEQKNPDNVFGKTNMSKILTDVESDTSLVSGFGSPRVYDNLAKALFYIPDIENQHSIWRNTAIQVDNIVYRFGLDKAHGDSYIWAKGVGPAVTHILNLQKQGKILLTQLNDGEVQQIVLPKQMTNQNITDGSAPAPDSSPNADMLVYNVSQNPHLGGLSPQEWLQQQIAGDYATKAISGSLTDPPIVMAQQGRWYDLAVIMALYAPPTDNWPSSFAAYQKAFDIVKKADDKVVFVLGEPVSLRYQYNRFSTGMSGQLTPYYSVLVGRELGTPVFVEKAPYPGSLDINNPQIHEEAIVKVSDSINNMLAQNGQLNINKYFGFWLYKDEFLKDYQNSQIKASLKKLGSSGNWETILG